MLRVRTSRFLGRLLTGRDAMICATLYERRHPAYRWIDAVLGRGHCRGCAAWEARQNRPEPGFVDSARRDGLL